MLSRIAEAMFWIGRYMERAEATTRVLSEHHQLLIEDTRVPVGVGAAALLDALAIESPEVDSASRLVEAVMGDAEDPSTILGSIAAARENARTIRESLPGDLFERLNATHVRLSGRRLTAIPGVALLRILDELTMVAGIIDWTMPRDEGMVFLRIGQAVERLDMTSRLLEIDHDTLWPQAGAATTLRAAGGFNPFLRTRSTMTGDAVRAFLVLDPAFPRSMLQRAMNAERLVRELESYGSADRTSLLLRTVGILRAELEFASSEPTRIDLHVLSTKARDAAFEASEALTAAFFRQAGTIVWSY